MVNFLKNKIEVFFDKEKIDTIFILFLILILPVACLIKEYTLLYISNDDFTFKFARVLIILFCVYYFLTRENKFDNSILILLFIHIMFIFFTFFGKEILFKVDYLKFYENIKVSDLINKDLNDYKKIIIINFFNVILPVIVFLTKNIQINLKLFEKYFINFFYFFLFLIIILFLIKFTNLFKLTNDLDKQVLELGIFFDYKNRFFNFHILFFPFAVFLLIKIIQINNIEIVNKFFIVLIFMFLLLIKANLIILCLSITYFFIKIKNLSLRKKVLYILFFLLIFTLFLYILQKFTGTIIESIYTRYLILEYLKNIENPFLFFGRSFIFSKIINYPHNYFLDIYLTTGLLGFSLFLIFLQKVLKKIYNTKINYLSILMIYVLIFSFFSGFFYLNITLNILLAASFKLINENEI